MRRRFLPVVLLASLAFVLAACGSGASSSSSTGGSPPAGAALLRSDLLGFVSIDSDLGSSQWQTFDKLWQKFPSHDTWLRQIEQSLAKQNLDYERDVKPALGPELDVGIAPSGSTEAVVGVTKPDDPAKLKQLAAKGSNGTPAVTRDLGDGWWAIADKASDFDAVLKGSGEPLSGSDSFTTAIGKLPGDALVRAYLDGPQLDQLVKQRTPSNTSGLDPSALGLQGLKYVAVSLSAEDDGLRLQGASSGGNLGGKEFASKLLDGVPSDAFAAIDFLGAGTTEQLQKLQSSPQFSTFAKQLEQRYGVTPDQLFALLDGEVAFYARSGAIIPELTLALQPSDPTQALDTVDTLMTHLAAQAGTRVEPGTQGGHDVKTATFGQFAIHYGSVDGKVLLTSGVNGIADFGSAGSLADSADFKEAKSAAGMPDSTGGLVYIDLKNAIPLIEGFAGLAGQNLPSNVTENLRPLRSLLAWSEGQSDERTFDAFLEIK
ncbi:MAG TPA: DUF3352 domain-containing protein [Gaiellaceae bacterium]|nr:DUF3352 domain-containing protein [Gaiellaceae bacterium]